MDEDYDVEDGSFAAAPTVRSAASSGSLSPPPMLAPPPGANAEQRRMVDMMNNRAMQMYRQVLMDRRSSENRQAIMDRQEAGRAFRDQQRIANQRATDDRADRRTAVQIDAENRRTAAQIAERERRSHEQRLKDDPDYRRRIEFMEADATAAGERNASRRDLLSALPQQPDDRYAGALPLQGGGGLRNPVTAMQMPEGLATAMPADPRAVEGAIDLSLKREFAAGPGAARVRAEATDKSANEIDVSDRRRTDRLLDSTARSVPQRRAFSGDPTERYETYKTALDEIIKAGKPEEKSGRVDVAAIPKVEDGMRDRMVSVIDELAVTNDMFPKDLARAVYDAVLAPTIKLKPVRSDNGVFLETEGGSRLVLTQNTYRQLVLLRGQTQKKFEEGKKAAETKKSTDAAIRRQAIDDADAADRELYVRGVTNPQRVEAAQALRATSGRANEFRRLRQEMGLE